MLRESPIVQRFTDKSIESTYALWNSLLTVNGILLSAFGIATAFLPKLQGPLAMLLIGACTLSLALLIWNYLVVKRMYFEIGSNFQNPDSVDLSAEGRRADLQRMNKQHKWMHYRESAALFLLLFEIAIFIVVLYLAGVFSTT